MKAKGAGIVLYTGGGLALGPEYRVAVASLVAGQSGLRGLGFALHAELKADKIHVGMVTIAGTVTKGTAFDPDRTAESYWTLYSQPEGAWTPEIIFNGAST